jgi:DNA-directed RNA polymerase subunit H
MAATQLLQQRIYGNIAEFITYRGIDVGPYKFMSDKDLTTALNIDQHVFITGKYNDEAASRRACLRGRSVLICLIAVASSAPSKLQDFRRLARHAIKAGESKADTKADSKVTLDVIFIAADTFSSNTYKEMLEYPSVHPEFLHYNTFIIVVPKHVRVPPHIIMDGAAAQAYFDEFYVTRASLPRIRSDDPVIIWIGGRAGDIIKIIRTSEIAGTAIAYRRVVEIAKA